MMLDKRIKITAKATTKDMILGENNKTQVRVITKKYKLKQERIQLLQQDQVKAVLSLITRPINRTLANCFKLIYNTPNQYLFHQYSRIRQ